MKLRYIALVTVLLAALSCLAQRPATNNASTSSGSRAAYLGLVGTRAEQSEADTGSGSGTWSMTRVYSYARSSVPANGLKLMWGNYYIPSNGTETNPGTGTFKAAIEYPAGTIYPCTFSGQQTTTISGLADALTDWCGPAIPQGAMFWTRVLYQNASGILYENYAAGHWSSTLDCFLYGTGTVTDVTYSGTCSGGGGQFSFAPWAIIGYTTKPSVCIVGDSRVSGMNDAGGDLTGDTGDVARSIGPVFAYTKLATPAITAAEESSNFTNRLRIINKYCTHAIDDLGINDVGAGTTASTIAGYRATLAALWPSVITIGTTLPASTTDTLAVASNASESGGTTVYTGTYPACGSGACNGLNFTVAGLGNANCNGGPWLASSTTTTTLTLANANASCTSETSAGTVTDNYTSIFNQTTSANPTAFNALVRAGITGEVNVFDLDYSVDPLAANKWPVSPNPFATTGTTINYATTDGVHGTNLFNVLLERGFIRTDWIY